MEATQTVMPLGSGLLATKGNPTPADLVAAVVMGLFALTMFTLVVVFMFRWKRASGADNKWDAVVRVFGEQGAHRIAIGWGAFLVIGVVLVVVVKATGG